MRKVKSVHIKPGFIRIIKIVGCILCVLLGIFIFYRYQISTLKKIGYSEIASKRILFSRNKEKVLGIGENKTVNAAFESDSFQEKNLDHYAKITYVEQKHLISNINKLLKIGYSNHDINIILKHGNDEAVSQFATREKVSYLEEFFSLDYAKLENYDRYVQYSDETGEDEIETVIAINLDLDKTPYEDATVVSSFSTDMIVNKYHYLKEDFAPSDLTTIPTEYASEKGMQCSRLALNAFIQMYKAAEKEGYELVINSAYRSYQDQIDIQNTYLEAYGQSYVDKYVAKPGFSEHQTGLAFDVGSRNSRIFANSKEYTWMLENAYRYGFILRFDERYEDLTGFRSEPWHFRYVGRDIAEYVYQHNNMSLEEYFVIFLDK